MFSLFKRTKIGCPFCLHQDATELYLSEEERQAYPLPKIFTGNTKKTRIKVSLNIDWTVIYSCTCCKTSFYTVVSHWTKVTDSQKELLKRWGTTSTEIPQEIAAELAKIGFSNWGNDDEILPCKIFTRTSEEIDFVTVQYCDDFPRILCFGDMFVYQKYFFIEDIQRIEASTFAVSKSIRDESVSIKEEVEKNFYPTIVANPAGKEFLFEGMTLFMNHPDAKGSELHLSENKWQKRKQYINDYTPQRQHLLILKKGKKGLK
ncbi:MAG TPA: hypothetical protein PL185_04400 [Flavobacteriales bacterium]|nr:hypothetical protein [Flavobacteriales bacterium]HPH81784.1 hypothetical protein [Flavobacteriales bacterium]